MSEAKQLIVTLSAIFIIGIAGYLAASYLPYTGDLIVENYDVHVSQNGLTETYLYNVGISDKYSMLFRVWNVPLVAPDAEALDTPHIQVSNINCPEGAVPYIRDHAGNAWAKDRSVMDIVEEKAYYNEAGCYFSGYYKKKLYTISASYGLYPPVECDSSMCRLNLIFADEHIPYRNVRIVLNDTRILKVFSYPPEFSTSNTSEGWTISGKSPENGLIGAEMLMRKTEVSAFVTQADDIEAGTESFYSSYSSKYLLLYILKYIFLLIALGFPVILYLIYKKYGSEKEFTVPEFLSFIPARRKPWLVNLVFNKDAFNFDEKGFFATLLDLQKREFIKIDTFADKRNKEIKITLFKNPDDADDSYEKDVISFLKEWSKDGVFETIKFKEYIKSISKKRESIISLNSRMDKIMRRAYPEFADEFVIGGRRKFFYIMGVSILMVFVLSSNYSGSYPIYNEMAIFSGTIAVQSGLIAFFTPSALFGRWKGEYYKEKMEWDAFRKFLLDIAMMKKYLPEDVVIWKEWLIYGTALGAGENVIKAMNALDVDIPEVRSAPFVYYSFHSVNRSVSSAYSAATGGGGRGGGGGFGGGGAGGR